MRNIIIGLVAILVSLALAGAGWFYRPWSEYSPAEIQRATQPDAMMASFRSMRDIFPYRTIRTGENPQNLPENTVNATVSYAWDGTTKTVEDWLLESDSSGLVVLHNGEIVHETYVHGSDALTHNTSWSVGKSYVATLIAMAMHDGLIDNLDQMAGEFAPQFAGTDYGNTSLRHLLMMSAGVDFNENYADPDSDIRELFLGTHIFGRDVDTMVAAVERDRAPGEDLHYVSANTHVLSAVVRAVYDDTLAAIVERKIWQPLGMVEPAEWNQNIAGPRGKAIGYCCLNATTRDYARFGQFYLQDGVWDGERHLPEGWVRQATRPNADFQEAGPDSVYQGRGYGLHFWVPEGHDGEYFMAGVYGQYVWVDERRNIVIARNAADQAWGRRTAESFAAMRALAAHYGDTPPIPDADTRENTESETVTESDTGTESDNGE
ncbi:serine hydrolase domain-containing protein [Maricaulis sp. D1M11]|uniref:serine hydrolase domain-containing protein n=1 Tax=Maricaulis sp. D1M11 TaxID=3076117 RepID=UPI0039B5FD8B